MKVQRRESQFLLALLGLASVLLVVGLVTPLMTIKTLVVMRNTFSVLSGVQDLWMSGKYVLFVLILAFSVILPFVKIFLLALVLLDRGRNSAAVDKLLHLAHDYGRWAMLDVLVVAVLLVTVKLGAIASVDVHAGLYVFGAAVLLIMVITQRVVKTQSKTGPSPRWDKP